MATVVVQEPACCSPTCPQHNTFADKTDSDSASTSACLIELLPCRHLVCQHCLQTMLRCSACRSAIKRTRPAAYGSVRV